MKKIKSEISHKQIIKLLQYNYIPSIKEIEEIQNKLLKKEKQLKGVNK
jgi:hypothetical protein